MRNIVNAEKLLSIILFAKKKTSNVLERCSIKKILALAVTFFVLIPCCIFIIFIFCKMYDVTAKEFLISQQKFLHQSSYILENIIDTVNSSTASLYLSSSLKDDIITANNSTNTAAKYRAFTRIRLYLREISSTLYTINGKVAIVTLDGTITDEGTASTLLKNLTEYDWYQKIIESEGLPYWDRQISEIFSYLKINESGITSARVLYSYSSEPIGIVAIMIPDASFWIKLKAVDLNYRGSMYVVTGKSNIITMDSYASISNLYENITYPYNFYSNNSYRSIQKIDIDAYRKLFIIPIGKTDFYLLNEISEKIMLSNLRSNISKTIILVIIVFLIFFVVVLIISDKISHPIVRLTSSINQVSLSDLNHRADVYGYKEVFRLSSSFNTMIEKMVQLIDDIKIQVALREKAHFDMLRAQINPHFLFNTLNSIKWLASINGVEMISDSISELGMILNSTLNRDDKLITLREELDILNAYINIQKLRYGNTFEYCNTISDNLKDYYVPKFILQPIVENSIIHGISETINGLIIVSANLKNSDLYLIVDDNGKGFPNELLDELLLTEKKSNSYMTGIGIKNIHERLKLQFGPKYGLAIKSNELKGFSVTLKIPVMLEPDLREGI